MKFIDVLKQNSTISNSKNGKYYKSTYNDNLDLFTSLSRYDDEDKLIKVFENAYKEDRILALANLLNYLDIRNGKGERRIFKTIFKYLCNTYSNDARVIMEMIGELGRFDYILEGIDTPINDDVLEFIKNQIEFDMNIDNPSLLAKWLPSHRTHGKDNKLAKKIYLGIGYSEKEYRKTLSELRNKIDIIEKKLTNKDYEIDFSKVPTKAMLKYKNVFNIKCNKLYSKYLDSLSKGENKINTKGLFCYEIVKKLLQIGELTKNEVTLYDEMWKNQKDFLNGNDSNILVVADTSGSMTCYNMLPMANSLGLATYIAERNTGIFKNMFITFSSEPRLVELKGKTIVDKLNSFESIVENTDIDKVFELLLNTMVESNSKSEDCPSHIIIISDMEFDRGVTSKNDTNFKGWKKAFSDAGYELPTIIFWNVAGTTNGVPVTKNDKNVMMVNGFSTSILENLLELENYTPIDAMISTLEKYVEMLHDFGVEDE